MKHMEEGNVEAAVSEMETMLKRLEKAYLSGLEPAAAAGAAPSSASPPAPRASRKAAAAR
jgi:hypothetical protein